MGIITVALASNATRSKKIVIDFTCDSSAVVGDWVYLDSVVDQKVIVATNNSSPLPVIGVIERKRNETTADVVILGTYEDASYSLTKGSTVYLDALGKPTTTPPTTGICQVIGFTTKNNEILVKSENRRFRRA